MEFALLPKSIEHSIRYAEKRYTFPPQKREKYPYDHLMKFVWHPYYITTFSLCKAPKANFLFSS